MPDLRILIGESIEGFVEGVIAPFLELIIALLIVVGTSIIQALANAGAVTPIHFVAIFALFGFIEIVRNVIMGFSLPFGGVGYIIGALIGLSWLAGVIPSNASWAVLFSIIFVIVGIVIRGYLFVRNLSQEE